MKTTYGDGSLAMGKMRELFSIVVGGSGMGFEEERKRSVLMLFLVIGILITLPFAVYHFRLGNTARAILLLLLGSAHLGSLAGLRYLKRDPFIFRGNAILLGMYLLFLIIVGGTQGSRLLWAFIFPLFSFFLLGKREGLLWSGLFFLASLVLFADPGGLLGTFSYPAEVRTRFVLVYALMVFMSYVVEAARQRYQEAMELAHLDLEKRVQQRTEELSEANRRLEKEIGDREVVQQELRSSERRLSDIVNFLPDATFVIDLDGKVIAWNHAMEALTGIRAGEVLGKGDYEYALPFYGKRRPVLIDLALHWDEGWAKTYEYVRRIGPTLVSETRNPPFREGPSLFWNTARPLCDGNGNTLGAIEVIRDITDRMLAEEALKAAAREKETILSTLMEHVIYEDREMKILWANRAACESAGLARGEIIGRHCYEIWPQREEPCPDCPVKRAMEAGQAQEVEKTTQDGRAWLIRGYPVRDAHDEVVGGIEVTLEITERKRAEAALKEASHILSVSPATAFLWRNEEGWPVEFVTSNVEALLGYPADDFVSGAVPYSRVIHPDDLDRVAREVAFYSGNDRCDHFMHEPYRILTKQGLERWVEDRTHIRKDQDGRITHYQGIVVDITDRKRAEEEREKLQAQLTQAQKMESIGRLAGGVAHDFNNMVGVIIGNAEIAMMQVDQEGPLSKNIGEIIKAGQRSSELVRQLLAFARKQTASPKVVDLNDTIPGTLKMLRRLIGEDIHLAWMPGHDLWNVKIDPSQIDQILANLAVNARDAIAGAGKMTIETENVSFDRAYCADHPGFHPGRYVLLGVSDDGAGMGKEVLEHLFEPFFTTKEVGKGTGLGLATIYGIVKQNGGFINVYSEPGKGTTFKIYLPKFEAGAMEMEARGEPRAVPRGSETVLMVEDEEAILTVGKTMLESLGYRVLTAGSPQAAIRIAGEGLSRIDLLFTDVVMPEMNGRELAQRLKVIFPHLKCLFMSGYTANVIAHHGVLDEGVKFLHKPFSIRDLAAKVREALDGD